MRPPLISIHPHAGLTRLEWLTFIVLSALMIWLAIPRFVNRDRIKREYSAKSTLLASLALQQRFQSMCAIDEDGDNVGEFASFGILCNPLAISALPPEIRDSFRVGEVVDGFPELRQSNGYLFRVFLETETSSDGINKREELCMIAAWPLQWGDDGSHCFFVTAQEVIYITDQKLAEGTEDAMSITDLVSSPLDLNTVDTDIWQLVSGAAEVQDLPSMDLPPE